MEQEKNLLDNLDGVICEIPIKFITLNGYVNICRSNRYQSAAYKKRIETEISPYIRDLPKFSNPVVIEFYWVEENKRRDLDNIAYAKKFILDALVTSGKLRNDSQKYVKGFSDIAIQGEQTKVVLVIREIQLPLWKRLLERVKEMAYGNDF